MALHRFIGMTVGVPQPDALASFYDELGLVPNSDATQFATPASGAGGHQITVAERPFRQLVRIELGCADEADLAAIERSLASIGIDATVRSSELRAVDPTTRVEVCVRPVAPAPLVGAAAVLAVPNAPGAAVRKNLRAPAVFEAARPPRRLGHVVIGSPDPQATRDFLVNGIGCKISDELLPIISFLRCSTDHHNVAVVQSAVPLLQHYSWECDDVDHVGHTATALLRTDERRAVWGLGRHFIGSNFYWYLRDPSGSFIELYSDLDMIDDDAAWERAGRTPVGFEHIANAWGPNLPPEFIEPSDVAELTAAWSAVDR